MSRPLLIILGIIGAGLLVLILNHDAGTSFGMENNQFADLLYMGVWGLVLAAALALLAWAVAVGPQGPE